jgi:hypothetical protein
MAVTGFSLFVFLAAWRLGGAFFCEGLGLSDGLGLRCEGLGVGLAWVVWAGNERSRLCR